MAVVAWVACAGSIAVNAGSGGQASGTNLVVLTERSLDTEFAATWQPNGSEELRSAPNQLIDYVKNNPDDKMTLGKARVLALRWANVERQNDVVRGKSSTTNCVSSEAHGIEGQAEWAWALLQATGDLQTEMPLSRAVELLGRPSSQEDGMVCWYLLSPLRKQTFIAAKLLGAGRIQIVNIR
jgi:hypothetical protein